MKLIVFCCALWLSGPICLAQNFAERTLPFPVSKVQAALKTLPGGTSGALPLLDGFVFPAGRSLETYKRPYYECSVRVIAGQQGGSVVRVTTKITAWNTDPRHPGYEVLRSIGRIESDLLDRLQDSLAGNAGAMRSESEPAATALKPSQSAAKPAPAPDISAPMPQFPQVSHAAPSTAAESENSPLEQEAKGLEQLLANQAHPTNLVAVREDQTPVLQGPSSDAKVLFLASAEDEFEVLDINPEWVHVRISGLSRGWLRRAAIEILDGAEPAETFSSDAAAASNHAAPLNHAAPAQALSSSKLFAVSGEEEGSFPGDWAPLKGKSVKIISIQQAPGTGRITSPLEKMRFAENLFRTETAAETSAGLVLIFDAEDGGMVAATRSVLELWRSGALSEQAFWKQCYLDPPEILGSAN